MRTYVLATSNPGKLRELTRLLPGDYEFRLSSELDVTLPPETGHTFEENAVLKATAAAIQTGLPAIADDSGLEVDALDGEPGVRSARYAGETASDEANVTKLLETMRHIPRDERTAHFTCAIAFCAPSAKCRVFTGTVAGRIAREPRGDFGFGYDPVFEFESGRTFAELNSVDKDAVSHRGKALRSLVSALEDADAFASASTDAQ
jgi:XTP/dITP diphosphohydrolase